MYAASDEQWQAEPGDEEQDSQPTYPLAGGRIVNWPCLFAFLTHIHETLSPPFHTPILLLTQACWTAHDREAIAQFCFEKFKTPALSLLDGALAVSYAYGVPTMTVVDVGFEKCDVTPVVEHLVNQTARVVAMSDCGGESLTMRLKTLLQNEGLDRDKCEQLKRDPICEILPSGIQKPEEVEPEEVEDEEGVLDVANIVASGKTSEFLARKEKTKNAAIEKRARLPNSQKSRASFKVGDGPEIEVGLERFEAASGGVLDRIADTVYRSIAAVGELEKRPELWNALAIVGNGSKVPGFAEALMATLESHYLIKLINPPIGQPDGRPQMPTSIRRAKMPEYFTEWKEHGWEEAGFLGAQLAARVIFSVDQGISKGFLSRSDYNELGPSGIHDCGL